MAINRISIMKSTALCVCVIISLGSIVPAFADDLAVQAEPAIPGSGYSDQAIQAEPVIPGSEYSSQAIQAEPSMHSIDSGNINYDQQLASFNLFASEMLQFSDTGLRLFRRLFRDWRKYFTDNNLSGYSGEFQLVGQSYLSEPYVSSGFSPYLQNIGNASCIEHEESHQHLPYSYKYVFDNGVTRLFNTFDRSDAGGEKLTSEDTYWFVLMQTLFWGSTPEFSHSREAETTRKIFKRTTEILGLTSEFILDDLSNPNQIVNVDIYRLGVKLSSLEIEKLKQRGSLDEDEILAQQRESENQNTKRLVNGHIRFMDSIRGRDYIDIIVDTIEHYPKYSPLTSNINNLKSQAIIVASSANAANRNLRDLDSDKAHILLVEQKTKSEFPAQYASLLDRHLLSEKKRQEDAKNEIRARAKAYQQAHATKVKSEQIKSEKIKRSLYTRSSNDQKEVIKRLGYPLRVEISSFPGNTIEVWYYHKGDYTSFINGKLQEYYRYDAIKR